MHSSHQDLSRSEVLVTLANTMLGRGAKAFLSSSGGNAGMAVAYAGKKLGIPVKVVVPETNNS